MKVQLAKTAGFCFGVKRAVDTVYEQVKKHKGKRTVENDLVHRYLIDRALGTYI